MRNDFGLPITVITGPATDNEVGQVYIQTALRLPAHNARRDAGRLLDVVRTALDTWHDARVSGAASVAGAGSADLSILDSRLLTLDAK
jgi:nicotinamide mononucleotide (NMN) deamidase PncC